MIPIVTPAAMKAVDAAAPEPVEVLIERAGTAVAKVALEMLGSSYGRRVAVLAGPGNNGADGRVAAERLRRRGAAVTVFDARTVPPVLDGFELVIDAAYGTGFHGEWSAPAVGNAAVLAVDIVTGLDAGTGAAGSGVLPADRTITFGAAKPGHVIAAGLELSGQLTVVDIGLDIGRVDTGPPCSIVERHDVASWLPARGRQAHKWHAAVRIVAGSPGMSGAAWLASAAAQRAGAGMVVVSTPGAEPSMPIEAVQRRLPDDDWAAAVLDDLDRFGALVIGPGLGLADSVAAMIREVVSAAPVPTVVDGDALTALTNGDGWQAMLVRRPSATVLTPHDGEFRRLAGDSGGAHRIEGARRLATATGSVVLRKGPATIVAGPDGSVLVVTSGDQRLATAGTGDVLSGIVGAVLAHGVTPFHAAAAAAWLHGRAGAHGAARGLIASDLVALLPAALAEVGQ